MYGLHAKEMVSWLSHFQKARHKNLVFVGILDKKVDDANIPYPSFQIEGNKTSLELPGIVDEILVMTKLPDPDNSAELKRTFVCRQGNFYGLPAKDRSGALSLFEPPHLGKLFEKIKNRPRPEANHFTY